MIKLAIDQKSLIDTHKDAQGGNSEFNFSTKEVIAVLTSLGYSEVNYSEQGYYREENRAGKGYHVVNFKSDSDSNIGICLIDSKDAQSSMKLFAGVFICDKVFPLVQFEEIKHKKHDLGKVLSLSDRISANLIGAENSVKLICNNLKEKRVSADNFNLISNNCFNLRLSHPNYTKTPESRFISVNQSVSGLNALKLVLSSYCDVNWPRHMVKLSNQIGNEAIRSLL